MTFRIPPQITTIFFDMNGTFMFGHDRFGAAEDFHASYVEAGGTTLDAPAVDRYVRDVVEHLDARYADPRFDRSFPSVATVIAETAPRLDASECGLIEAVIARHEFGTVSAPLGAALGRLAKRYRLAVVSNLWSASAPWRDYLDERVGDMFTTRVFSADIGINKPAPEIFEHAMRCCEVSEASSVLMVGDDWRRDIEPAQALGFLPLWVSETRDPVGVARIASILEIDGSGRALQR